MQTPTVVPALSPVSSDEVPFFDSPPGASGLFGAFFHEEFFHTRLQ